MQKFKVLVLTDHTNHSAENSLYALLQSMRKHPRCAQIDVATRANISNDGFFKNFVSKDLVVSEVDESFEFSADGKAFQNNLRSVNVKDYDAVWLRMPPPLSKSFLIFLKHKFPNLVFINDPDGIYQTGSKAFLENFPTCCAPMKICKSVEDIIDFKNKFPIVLKPFRDYGGKGIVRIDGNQVWDGKTELTFDKFVKRLSTAQKEENFKIEYLGVKFLKNVSQGDKRIVVVDGKIMGASLRLPPKDSWICNVAMGGTSNPSEVDEAEIEIIKTINPLLSELGIVMYGVDTLVGDDGKRILSEINTTSIGGLPQIAKLSGQPLVEEAIDLIWKYIVIKIKNKVATN